MTQRRSRFFGIRIQRFLSPEIAARTRGRGSETFSQRAVRFIEALPADPARQVTYDLRTVVWPERDSETRVEVFVLGRVGDASQPEALAEQGRLFDLAEVFFDEFDFAPLDGDEVAKALDPFPIRSVHEILQRGWWIPSGTSRLPADRVLHIAQFLPPDGVVNRLWNRLLRSDAPMMVSIRLRGTRLRSDEVELLERQTQASDEFLEQTTPDRWSTLREKTPLPVTPAQLEQAASLGFHSSALLGSLRTGCALLTVQLASACKVAPGSIQAMGAHLTLPVGGANPWHSDASLHGGYRTIDRSIDKAAREAMSTLEFALPVDVVAECSRLPFLFDLVSAARVFRFPLVASDPPDGVDVRRWFHGQAPRTSPKNGVLLGRSVTSGADIRLGQQDRMRHVYVVGKTGTGKTTLLRSMILDDIRSGAGLCLMDPHGDLFESVLGAIPPGRVNDVVVVDPADAASSVVLNPLECQDEAQKYFIVQEFLEILVRLVQDQFGSSRLGDFIGPIFMQHARMSLLLIMSDPKNPGTLLDLHRIFHEEKYWKRWAEGDQADPLLRRWVESVLPSVDYLKQGSEGISLGGYIGSKLEPFLFDPRLRHMFTLPHSTIELRTLMDEGKILLVNLARGLLTDANSRFLGMLFLAQLQAAAMSRVTIPEHKRRPFYVYVDEFQNVATQTFISLLSEARKFGVGLVLSNQFVSQNRDDRIMESILGNIGSLISFRLGPRDAIRLEQEFYPTFDRQDLVNLPNWTAYASTLVAGQPSGAFSLRTVMDAEPCSEVRAIQVREASQRKYGAPTVVEPSVPTEPDTSHEIFPR